MSVTPGLLWPWLALVGLGVFHGINPAMGWLFAVALGLHRRSRRIVLLSWVPIALGHAAAVALVLVAVLALGLVVDSATLSRGAAAMLLGWALWHAVRGHRQRLRIGMQAGLAGLAFWSFLMSSAHGAGLMLIPVLLKMPVGVDHAGHQHMTAMTTLGKSAGAALAAVGVHTLAMLAVTGLVAILVYEWVGLTVLRRGWINLDLLWALALIGAGTILLAAAVG